MSKDRAGKGLATYSCYLPARLLSNAAVILLSGCRLFFFPQSSRCLIRRRMVSIGVSDYWLVTSFQFVGSSVYLCCCNVGPKTNQLKTFSSSSSEVVGRIRPALSLSLRLVILMRQCVHQLLSNVFDHFLFSSRFFSF